MNAIRVIGITLLAFAFLLVIIITTIRKKEENQPSILLRIMTNYLQLIAATMSFGLNIPNSLASLILPADSMGSSSDSFLSFDCLLEDTEMKLFTPSTEIFKVILVGILPLVLIGLF